MQNTLKGKAGRVAAVSALVALFATSPALAQGIAGPYLAAEHAARLGDVDAAADRYASALARDPDNAVLLQRALIQMVGAGRIAEAVAAAHRLQQLRPGQHLAVITLVADALRNGEGERALATISTERNEGTAFVTGLLKSWAMHASQGRDKAVAYISGLEENNTGGPAGKFLLAYHRGLAALAEGDDAAAVAAFDEALEQPGTPTRHLVDARAGALARLGRTDEALRSIDERLAETYGDPGLEALAEKIARGDLIEPFLSTSAEGASEALFGLSRYLSRGPNRATGLAYARLAVHLDPTKTDAHLLIAAQMMQQENHALAIQAYGAVPEDVAEALDARIGRAEALEAKGETDAAVQAMREVVLRWPSELDAHRGLGDMLRRLSRFEEAADAYDGAVALIDDPQQRHWPVYYQRGIARERSKQWDGAEADFRMALKLQPDQPLVLNYLGYSWVEMGENLAEAQEMIEKAVEQRPEDGYIVDSLGWVLYRLGDFEGAVKHLGRAVELRPVDPVINDHYGDALWMVGREVEARFQWTRSLSFDPEPDVAARIEAKLDEGLEAVLEREAAAGMPAIIGRSEEEAGDKDGG